MIQGYNDTEKTALLTQALTIQENTHCLFLSISPTLWKQGMKIMLWDIKQAYIRLKTELNYIIICHLSVKLKKRCPESTVLYDVKQLYGLIEAGNHYLATY